MISRLLPPPKKSFLLLGPRMTGKSTWLNALYPDALRIHLLESNHYQRYLSQPSLLAEEALAFQKKNRRGWMIIDEIQRVPELLNEIHHLMESTTLRFGLSGSSARKLKRGGANLLAGRAIEHRLFPFNSIELGSEFNLSSVLQFGSLPSVWVSEDRVEKRAILRTYVSTYLREEIQAEGFVRNLPSFSRFLQLAADCIAQEVNFTSISREVSVTSKTVRDYFGILEDTLIGFLLLPWKKSIRKELAGSPKFYLFDNGVTNALRENLTDKPTGVWLGSLFEQWLIQEARSILAYRQFEGSLYYWKARGGNEIDLIIARGNNPLLAVEIKNTSNPSKSDLVGLRSFSEEYPKTAKILVTNQAYPRQIEGIESTSGTEFIRRLWAGEWTGKD